MQQQRFQFSDPHRKTFHGHRFDPHFAQRRGHEIIALVAGDERHIGDGGKFRFEFFLGVNALGGVGQLFEIAWACGLMLTIVNRLGKEGKASLGGGTKEYSQSG